MPDGTEVSSVAGEGSTEIVIKNCPVGIASGDLFAVYDELGLPWAYLANEVSVSGGETTVVAVEADPAEAFLAYDVSGEQEVDLSAFQEADGVDAVYVTESDDAGARPRWINWDGKTKQLSFSASARPATVTGAVSKMSVKCNVNPMARSYYVSLYGTLSFTASVKTSWSGSFPIGVVSAGPATVGLYGEASFQAGLTHEQKNYFETGVQYTEKDGFRAVKNFKKLGFTNTISARGSVALTASASFNAYLAKADVRASVGLKASYSAEMFSSGTPAKCETLKAHLFAEASQSATFGAGSLSVKYSRTYVIWGETNSPARSCYHYEDGKRVYECSRGIDYAKWTSRSSSYGYCGYGGGSSTGYADDGSGGFVPFTIYEYTLDDQDRATITKYYGNVGALTVPETIDGYTVVKVGASAFKGNASLRVVQFPDTVTEIGYSAFEGCSSLASVDLSDSLAFLGYCAFGNCDLLSYVLVPASLEECGHYGVEGVLSDRDGAFNGCDGLRRVEVAEGAKTVAPHLLENCPGVESVSIPSTVTSVGKYSFRGSSLPAVDLPDTVTEIGEFAFANCSSLKKIDIPDSVTSMGTYVFAGCSSLEEAKLPAVRQNVTEGTFQNCTSLKAIEFPDTLVAIRKKAFQGCSSLAEVSVPAGVKLLEDYAFYGCSSLKTVNLSAGVASLGAYAFSNCDSLAAVSLPNSVAELGNCVFYDCDALKDVSLGTGVTVIPSQAFKHCDVLESFTLPYRVATVKNDAFAECVKLASVTVPRATTSIASDAFSYPAKMTIYGVSGTYAEEFAKEKSIKFVSIEVNVSSVSFDKEEMTLNKGATGSLSVTFDPVNFTDEVSWKSSDTSVATVSDSGVVEAVGVGDASIKLLAGTKSAVCKVHVLQPVTSVSFNKSSLTLEALAEYQLKASVYPSNANNKALTWGSSDEKVATVDDTGKVTAHAKGSATITATAADGGGASRSCTVTVSNTAHIASTVDEMQSPHNYEDNSSDFWVYSIEGASSLKLVFDERTTVEDGFDYIYVLSSDGTEVGKYTGGELAGGTVVVPGDTVRVKLVADKSGNEWGFALSSIEAVSSGEEPTDPVDPVDPTDPVDPVDPEASVVRIAGDYANQTSALISGEAFPDGKCGSVVLARDDDFRDAMSAAGLAGSLGCPVLLTSRDGLSDVAAAEIERLGALSGAALAGGLEAPVLLANGQADFGSVDVSAVEGFLAKHDVGRAYVLGGTYVMPDETVLSPLAEALG